MESQNEVSNTSINEYTCHIKIKDEGDLKATVILQYKDIKIKGFRIVRSKYENNDQNLWLQVPSYRAGNFYHKMFFLDNEESWKVLEAKILKEYEAKYDEYYQKKFGVKFTKHKEEDVEEINVDDIKF